MYSSVALSAFTLSWNPHDRPSPECFAFLNGNAVPIKHQVPIPSPDPHPWTLGLPVYFLCFQSVTFLYLLLCETFYFVLGYSRLTNNATAASGGQQRDSVLHSHVPILPQLLSRPGCHTITEQSSLCYSEDLVS